jgi:hypothetical protein
VFLKVSFCFACNLHQIRATEPTRKTDAISSTLIILKSEPYMLDRRIFREIKIKSALCALASPPVMTMMNVRLHAAPRNIESGETHVFALAWSNPDLQFITANTFL